MEPLRKDRRRLTPRSKRRLWIGGGAVVLALTIAAVLVFQPWLLLIDVRVDDEIPKAAAGATSSAGPSSTPAPAPSESSPPAAPLDIATGTLISHEHTTTGTLRVIELPTGQRQLAIENLDTTNGPDVHVWLSAGPTIEGFDGWFTAGSYDYIDLGPIKGNQGNQLYDIPADVDLAAYPSVSLWCVQFSVSFGGAGLTPV